MSSAANPWPASISPDAPIVLFDGVCNLCNGLVQFVIHRDTQAKLRLASLQSPAGQALLKWCGKPLDDFDTMVFIERGKAYFNSSAALRIARYLSWPWPILSIFLVIPPFVRNLIYRLVARKRYNWFGRRETCMMPTAEDKRRFLQ